MAGFLVTGASGFVGRALVARLCREPDARVTAASRSAAEAGNPNVTSVRMPDFEPDTDWGTALHAAGVVFHCAGLTPGGAETSPAFRRINCDCTINLARQAAAAGVAHFVFISTAQIHGAATGARPFDERSAADPRSPYAVSKWEAEQALEALSRETGMAVTIVRPPLVYGRGAKGNLAQLAKLARTGLPLPFAGADNRRSLVALDNLTDFLARCASRPATGCDVYLIADGQDLSTGDIIAHLARDQGTKARLFSVPPRLMTGLMKAAGRGGMAERLFGSFQLDIGKARQEIGWTPVTTPDTAPWI